MADHHLKGNISAKGKGFDGNPQNINRKGRPKEGVERVVQDLLDEGIDMPTKAVVKKFYGQVMNLNIRRIQEILANKELPLWVHNVCNIMLDSSDSINFMRQNIDWLYGKATQTTEVSVESKSIEYIDIGLGSKQKEAE